MMNPKNLRNPNTKEFKALEVYLTQISPKISLYLEAQRSRLYIISTSDTKSSVYLITDSLKENLKHFESTLKITSAGTYIGFMENGKFFLSLEGAEFFLTEKLIPYQVLIKVNEQGEKSILYGNPIEKKMISNIDGQLKKHSLVLILNQSSELISLGSLEVDPSMLDAMNEREIVVNNLVDKGYYLRRKQ